MSTVPPSVATHRPSHKWRWIGGGLGLVVLIVGALAICEWRGWPMLRRPAEDWTSQRLNRQVSFAGGGARWRLHLLGGVKLQLDQMEVGAPEWSTLGSTLVAQDVTLKLHYADLFAFRRGQPLRIKSLEAANVALRIQRLADGRASWQFGPPDAAPSHGFDGVRFEQFSVGKGSAIVDDRVSALSMVGDFEMQDGFDLRDAKLVAHAEGRYRAAPLRASLQSGSALPWLSSDPKAPAVPVVFKVELGQAGLDFRGTVRDLLATQGLDGDYALRGPSLAAAGQPLGVTLPTTPPFTMRGHLLRSGPRWTTQVHQATVGRSVLKGEFVFDRSQAVPMLSGQLQSPILWLADLGPAIGTRSTVIGPAPKAGLGLKKVVAMAPPPGQPTAARTAGPGRVLPDRPFDLPSLRAMNADVRMDITRLESGVERLESIAPLRTRLILQDGVLTLQDIDARLAQGRITGRIKVDGTQPSAKWDTRLSLRGLKLEQWLSAAPVTGRLAAELDLQGRGRSTAEMLASASGRAQLFWNRGTVSHKLIEESGIDVAQTLGLMIKGDDALPVDCAAADLRASEGMVRPAFMLVDTKDSALRVDGGVSLATERLGLTLHVAPKDISPLALRTPIQINGTFGKPDISLQKGPLVRRLVPAAALAAINPLAALLPLIDTGDKQARADAEQCQVALRGLDLARQAEAQPDPKTDPKTAAVGQR
ncbi:AsmA family protein [Pelomonas sp. KK5]|uniref:AsmA family protein n=1 Tax=Pelomonas sp. KK5 TaxID=1855730 RepID=UPI00117CE0C5|nr:AsmA family protein [Pelomonas sp. KK5]